MADYYLRGISQGGVEAAAKAVAEFEREVPTATGWRSCCEYGVHYSNGFEPQFRIHRTNAGNVVVKEVG